MRKVAPALHKILTTVTASMGPQLDSCGRWFKALDKATQAAELQWGRNLTVAEGEPGDDRLGDLVRFNGAAT